jgi:hypothetical protein
LGYAGSKTILHDYLREVRPVFAPRPRTFQRTVYRPGELNRAKACARKLRTEADWSAAKQRFGDDLIA